MYVPCVVNPHRSDTVVVSNSLVHLFVLTVNSNGNTTWKVLISV